MLERFIFNNTIILKLKNCKKIKNIQNIKKNIQNVQKINTNVKNKNKKNFSPFFQNEKSKYLKQNSPISLFYG